MTLPIFASVLAFLTYSLTNHDMNPAQIFSSLALFNSLRMPLNLLPLVIGQVVDAWQSIQRIEEYLLSEEQEEEAKFDVDAEHAVVMRDADFTWERTASQDPNKIKDPVAGQTKEQAKAEKAERKQAVKDEKLAAKQKAARRKASGGNEVLSDDDSTLAEQEPFKLQGMNFSIGRNELVAVIGSVASGKSSLLSALAGDMRKVGGTVEMGASRAFCPGTAWIQNASVRENILFGKEMERHWYKDVIEACALKPDFDMLPQGDATEIGERGITVSGGQKQRLNIARAIYFDADLILMDDPLSAVDAHVGRHIFDKAIMGLLKDKARILATHQLWLLNRCDRIIWMEEGKILAIDTFENLMRDHKGFQTLMATTAKEEAKDEKAVDGNELEDNKKDSKKKTKVKLMQAEEKAVSSVSWSVYGDYIKASGSLWNLPLVVGLLLISQASNIVTSLWLTYWTSDRKCFTTSESNGCTD
jgi:ATP-binding cassette subfamily C (CFTR/MRP) protein 1